MSTLGHQAGGIVGFLSNLGKLVDLIRPRITLVIWESGGSPRRRAIFPDYKKGRKPPKLNRYYEDIPDSDGNRIHQVRFLVDTLKHVGVCQMFIEDCEADDVIGFICRNRFNDEKKVIASSDRDFYQLLDENTTIFSFTSDSFVGPADVTSRFNIAPMNFALAKAVTGDPSDAIPGVEGIGFKSLAKRFDLISEQRDIDWLVERSRSLQAASKKPPKLFGQIIDERKLISRNLRVMYLDMAGLSASQIRKIDAAIDSFDPKRNKMHLMRALKDEGLASFDVHSFFSAFKTI